MLEKLIRRYEKPIGRYDIIEWYLPESNKNLYEEMFKRQGLSKTSRYFDERYETISNNKNYITEIIENNNIFGRQNLVKTYEINDIIMRSKKNQDQDRQLRLSRIGIMLLRSI